MLRIVTSLINGLVLPIACHEPEVLMLVAACQASINSTVIVLTRPDL